MIDSLPLRNHSPRMSAVGYLTAILWAILPLVAVFSTERRVPGVGTAILLAFDLLLLCSFILPLVVKRTSVEIDRTLFRIAGVLGLWLVISGLYGGVIGDKEFGSRELFFLAHQALPYFWFAFVGPLLVGPSMRPEVTRYLLIGILSLALWQFVETGLIVLREGQNAWLALAASARPNQNVIGNVLVVGGAALLPYSLQRPSIVRWGIGGIILFAIAWTFSRSTYVATLAVIAAYFLRSSKGIFVLLISGVLVLCGIFFAPNLFLAPTARIAYTTETGGLDVSSQVRLSLWEASVDQLAEHPIMGLGFGRSVEADLDAIGIQTVQLVYSHNYFLTMGSQTGFPGLILSVLLMAYVYILGSRAGPIVGDRVKLVTIAIIIVSMFGEPLLVPALLTYFLLIASTATTVRREGSAAL